MPIVPLTRKDDLARIFTWQETRILSKNLTLQFRKVVYQIQTSRPTYAMRNAAVTVCLDDQETVTLLYRGKSLPYTIYHKQTHQAQIVETKNLDRTLVQRQPSKPAADHPWRQGFATPLSRTKDVPTGGTSLLWKKGEILTLG